MSGDMPWILGTLGAIAFFAFFERRGLDHAHSNNTLSYAVYTIGSKWPLSIFIMGQFCGGLAVHFFWHWCPPGSVSIGMIAPDGWFQIVGNSVFTHPIGIIKGPLP